MAKQTVAVVGRPNVGKSTFFNKVAGVRLSIVDDTPGVTRDRICYDTEWNGKSFRLVDTGGIEPVTDSEMLLHMRRQAELAIANADVVIMITDVGTGVTAADAEIAAMLKKAGKKVIPAVNKIDKPGEIPAEFYEFYSLGFDEDPIPLSSLHGTGTGDILDRVCALLPDIDENEDTEGIKVAVIGKPNAGKSSIVNRITGENRVIVSDVPGTTRDAVDSYITNRYGNYTFIDTAGIRRNSKIDDRLERFSVMRAELAVDRSDVCLIMIDAGEGVTAQDERIAGLAHNGGKASIIVCNKWDTIEKDNDSVKEFTAKIRSSLAYMEYAPIMFVSAKTGQRIDKLFPLINSCYENASRRITTGLLNDLLAELTARVQPPTDKGRRLKIYYMTQTGTNPPTFVVFCNSKELFHFSYQRYIENCLRKAFDFGGTPIRLIIKQKGEDGV